MQNEKPLQMYHFITQSISISKPIGTTSDVTLQKHHFQFSSKTDLSWQPPLFLSGFSLALKALSLTIKTNKSQITSPGSCLIVFWHSPNHNHYYHIYQREQCNRTLASFRNPCNHCKRTIKRVATHNQFKAKVENNKLWSCSFLKIPNMILNEGKLSA